MLTFISDICSKRVRCQFRRPKILHSSVAAGFYSTAERDLHLGLSFKTPCRFEGARFGNECRSIPRNYRHPQLPRSATERSRRPHASASKPHHLSLVLRFAKPASSPWCEAVHYRRRLLPCLVKPLSPTWGRREQRPISPSYLALGQNPRSSPWLLCRAAETRVPRAPTIQARCVHPPGLFRSSKRPAVCPTCGHTTRIAAWAVYPV